MEANANGSTMKTADLYATYAPSTLVYPREGKLPAVSCPLRNDTTRVGTDSRASPPTHSVPPLTTARSPGVTSMLDAVTWKDGRVGSHVVRKVSPASMCPGRARR